MGRIRLALSLCLGITFLFSTQVAAQWSVVDATNLVQNTTTAMNTARQVTIAGQQLIAQYNMIRNMIIQIENQVKNLQRIPEGLNILDTILSYGQRIDALLGQAQSISFYLDQSVRDFTQLYVQSSTLRTAGDIVAYRQRLLTARLQASGMAVKMQSVRTNLTDLYNRIARLLNGSWGAQGNLDSHQIAAQQQALIVHSLREAQAMHAATQRLEAQRQAEDVALKQLALSTYRQATTLAPLGDWRSGPQLDMVVRGGP